MRKVCSVVSAPLLFVVLVSLCTQAALAQISDRVQAIENANMAPLAGSVHPLARAEFDRGLTDNAKVLSGMSINFKRSDEQEANLKALLAAQQTPGSPSYHKWLTPAQFGQQFGMSAADIARVSDWLQSQGFTITAVSQSANSISFSGQVAAVEKAFQTEIHNYSVNGQAHFANSTQISIPAALSGTVSAVHGLDDFHPRPKVRFLHNSTARFTSGVSGSHYLAPGDIAVIYDVNPLYTAGFTGKGLTIVVVGQTDIVLSDITNFRSAAGLTVNNPTVVTVPGTTPETVANGSDGDLAESDLDLEWSGAVANAASIILVNSDDVFTSLQYAIQNAINGITVPIISMSYGECEAQTTTSTITDTESYLEQANGQGQTVMLAAGDSGAADCDDSTSQQIINSATQGLAVDYPGSSPYVTSVGGSEFMGDGTAASPQTGSGTYWSANGSNDVLTSAKSYIPEMAWNDTTFSVENNNGLSAGGGGVSKLFTKPSWQTGVPNIPADGFRDVPDVSLDASPDHDSYIYCTSDTSAWVSGQENSCNSGFRDSATQDFTLAGGTSFAAPSFSGLVAIIEQKLGSGPLGNIDPSLYTMASNATTYASAFHDITTGNNQVPCTNSSPDCATTGSNNVIGYVAGTGYDQATGIGSVDANNLATAYAALVKATGTTTALTVSPGNSVVINEKVTFTATVTPNTLSTAPAGTVTFYVDGVAGSTSPVTIATASPFTATYQTDFPSAGTHTVTATYSSSDSTYTGSSSSSLVVTVAASGTAATTTTVTASPTSLALGSSITLTATVSGTTAGTLTGPMTFTTGGVSIGKVTQVTIGSGNTATATLTVNATTSLGFAAGTDTITASYGGDTFNATSSGTTNVTVTNPSIGITATNITISSPSPGNTATSTITLTSMGGYAGTANITATPGTLNATGTFGTTSIVLSAGGTGSTTLTITTIAATGNVQKGLGTAKLAAAGGTIAGCLLLLLVPGIRRKRWPAAVVMLVFLSVGAGLGCGGGTAGASPAGTYTVTVSAADSSNTNITGTGTFTVTIN